MGFVNAYLTEEEKALFEAAKIPDPVWLKKDDILMPEYWTIDREKNTALVYCGVPDREEHEKEAFALFLNGIGKEQMVIVRLEKKYRFFDDEYKKLKLSLDINILADWKFVDARTCSRSTFVFNTGKLVEKKEFAAELTEALSAYGQNGDPDSQFKAKAFIDFGDGV